jgi:hypothetical protein
MDDDGAPPPREEVFPVDADTQKSDARYPTGWTGGGGIRTGEGKEDLRQCECVKKAVRESILALVSRPYGWDGKDALPIRPDSLGFCVFLFGENTGMCMKGMGMPLVTLLPDGVIELTFEHEDRELVIQFVSNWVAAYVQTFQDGETTVEGVIRYDRPEDCERLVEILKWVGMKD